MLVVTFSDFVVAVADFMGRRPESWRAGQTAFNLLVQVNPTVAEMVRGSDFDPFYRDDRLVDFYDFVCRHWDD